MGYTKGHNTCKNIDFLTSGWTVWSHARRRFIYSSTCTSTLTVHPL